ncbi:MAG: FeoB-associated Cys-rich membrane protein [Polaribacter sp.]|nr:FeoB-associated Cys-rich membrane protein [Polaribacter sp.]MDG1954848.1 FeoB-associated Cys-rich membrane protein [Polaribacter sp.]MDG2074612.1 FeoB-associated Cys-rich membrane protein [Polaribacter sp.]
MQEIISYIVLIIAVSFLLRKFVFKSKKNKNGCDTNCGCA